jgi:hypothetical protein
MIKPVDDRGLAKYLLEIGAEEGTSQMRWKIIVVNAGIVLTVGLLTYLLLSASLVDVLADPGVRKVEVAQALRSATARIGLDALQAEDWLRRQSATEETRSVYAPGVLSAREEAATAAANRLRDLAIHEPRFAKRAPSMVLFVDAQGAALGRNGSALMRRDQMLAAYPSLAQALTGGETGSAVWLNQQRQEQMLVSFAPVRDQEGKILGALVLGTPLSDDWLTRVSELTSGAPLIFGIERDGKVELVAHGEGARQKVQSAAAQSAALDSARSASREQRVVVAVEGTRGDVVFGAMPLSGYEPKSSAVLVAAIPAALVDSVSGLLRPVLGVTALGLLMVIIAGWLLGNYFARPVSELEDGLLSVINGNSQLRFQIEHPDLGGLVFRINSLLNALTGVPEDTTDEQGKPSRPPTASDFQEALDVDESSAGGQPVDDATAAALASEPSDDYYRRLYREYISAKRGLGDPVDHITLEAFVARIRATEQEMSAKYGRPVRCQVQVRDDAGIVLIAVPLPA